MVCVWFLRDRLYCLFGKFIKEEDEVAAKRPPSLSLSAKQQRAIWDDATYVEISVKVR